MTPLGDKLIRRIQQAGPIPLADYMQSCLLDPEHGYYATRDPFGQTGDFITAPEISQMFGELIGLSLAQAWLDQGAPAHFTLAELGPGRGTLMADALRATKAVPGFHAAAQIVLVEASATLRKIQRHRLDGHKVSWADDVTTLPDHPLYLIANEFFDALPIRQYTRQGQGWRERMVGVSDAGNLTFGLGGPVTPEALAGRLGDTKTGDIVELCPAAMSITTTIATRIAQHGGAALFIDYGGWRSLGDTFQALTAHEPVDPFAAPGLADLTAHVDFEALSKAAAAAGAQTSAMCSQGVLLERLGITARAQALAQKMSGDALEAHIAAHRRLTHPREMGNLFKTLGLAAPGGPLPPGTTT